MQNEQNNTALQLTIARVDYMNPTELGYAPMLSPLSHTSEITDINEIISICIQGDSCKDVCESMPKSWKVKVHPMHRYENGRHDIIVAGFVKFDTFNPNKVTGEKNEAAIKRRIKIIEKLASLGL